MIVVLDETYGYLAPAKPVGMQTMKQLDILIDMGDEKTKLLAGFNITDQNRA